MTIDPVSLGITLALTAANMALTASQTIEGPRLDSTKFTGGDYGAPLPMTWGTRRLECPIFWAEDLREVKRRRKTKGGKFNEYTYYGTWAVALAGHEVGGVTRIWFDTHLVYDTTGAGPVTPFDFGGRGTISDFLTVYLGTETQEPDPRMQATVEAEFGEGSCPAYRGTAYVMFKDVPLEKIGNRIPQVSIEVISSGSPAYPVEVIPTTIAGPGRLWGATFSTDFSRFMWNQGDDFEIIDVAARAPMLTGTFGIGIGEQPTFGLYANGDILATGEEVPSGGGNQFVYRFAADGASYSVECDLGDDLMARGVRVIADGTGTEHWMTLPYSARDEFFVDGVSFDMNDLIGIGWAPNGYFADANGNIWAVGRQQSFGTTTAYFYRLITVDADGPDYLVVSGLEPHGSTLYGCTACHCEASGMFVLAWDEGVGSHLYAVDPADGSVTDSLTITLDVYNTEKQFANLPPGASTIWLNNSSTPQEIDLASLTVGRTIDVTDWPDYSTDGILYDPVNNALWTAELAENEIKILFLDRISGDGVTLGTICGDVADLCGIADHDFTALDQTVQGWSATQGQASNIAEPLLTAFDSDIRPHGFEIEGIKRTGTSGGTILTERFVKAEPRYSVTIRQAAELPRAALVTFADVDADQQPNTARADRPLDATGARGERSLDMGTWASDTDEARQIAERYFRRLWNERREVSLSLTAQHLALEPGDVRTLNLDGQADTYRLTRLTVKASGELATEWKYDAPSLAVLSGATGAAFDGRDDSTVAVPLLSKAIILDIPLLRDVDNSVNPLLYVMAGPYGAGSWPGAAVYEAVDGEYTEELASIPASEAMTWGTVAEELPYSNPNLWDRVNEITVTLQNGELAGTTEAAIDANTRLNLAVIGGEARWEIVQFTTATLTAPNTYTVSGFKRGRRGTEWAAELHGAGDLFVLVDTAVDVEQGLSEVTTNETFKAITNGRTESGALPTGLTPYTGATLKPYAPCQLDATQDGSDWQLEWVRRTRVGGAWTGGGAIPLSEASEEYEVEIMDGDDVVRTVTGLTSPEYLYEAADQTTDFGAPLDDPPVYRVYQISDAVGRGFAAEYT